MYRWQWPKLLIRCSRPGVQRRPHATVWLEGAASVPASPPKGVHIGRRNLAPRLAREPKPRITSRKQGVWSNPITPPLVRLVRGGLAPSCQLAASVAADRCELEAFTGAAGGRSHALELSAWSAGLRTLPIIRADEPAGCFAKCLAPVLEVCIQVGINAGIACCADPRDLSKRLSAISR
jgi:hypothetical protein